MPSGSDMLKAAEVEGVSSEPYRCEACRDTGWVMKVEQGREAFVRCVPCAQEKWDRMCARRFSDGLTWKHWRQRKELEQQVKAMRDWRGDPWCVTMHGDDALDSDNRGAGKTHAALATGRAWIKLGWSVRAWDWADLMRTMKRSIADPSSEPSALDDFDGLLILDDMGERDLPGQPPRNPSAYDLEAATAILKAREKKHPTIVTTNLGLVEFDRKFWKVGDRLATGLRLRWVAASWRRK